MADANKGFGSGLFVNAENNFIIVMAKDFYANLY